MQGSLPHTCTTPKAQMIHRFPIHPLHVLFLCVLCSTCGVARQLVSLEPDTTQRSVSRLFPLPILFYTPETGVAGGAAALLLMRDTLAPRPSTLTANVIYTERKQAIAELDGDLYFHRDDYRLLTQFVFQRYPNKFFGIGDFTSLSNEETYTLQSFVARAVLYRTIVSNVHAGPLLRYETASMKEIDPAGLLASGTIMGSNGSSSAGLGFALNWDSRDNTFAASSGSFYQITGLFYSTSFGGNQNFNDILIDTRNYIEVFPAHVVAFQAAAEFMGGNVPFQNLVRFGGQNTVRGYYDGRYRDKNGIALQGEYRFPVWWRFGVIAFAGVGQVAHTVSDIALNRFWFAGGGGLRFYWNDKEHISLRLDCGIGNNSTGTYITVSEAF